MNVATGPSHKASAPHSSTTTAFHSPQGRRETSVNPAPAPFAGVSHKPVNGLRILSVAQSQHAQSQQAAMSPKTPVNARQISGLSSNSPSPSQSGTKRKRRDCDDDDESNNYNKNGSSDKSSAGQDNERLSKRLSHLNLAEHISKRRQLDHCGDFGHTPLDMEMAISAPGSPVMRPASSHGHHAASAGSEFMDMDDTKHRVFISNLDDELSESEAESEEGAIVIHPDFKEQFRANRPQFASVTSTTENDKPASMQLVLYQEPSAISIPEEQDSVRRAIVEARERIRERQNVEAIAIPHTSHELQSHSPSRNSGTSVNGLNGAGPSIFSPFTVSSASEFSALPTMQCVTQATQNQSVYDPDVMDMDID